MLRYLLLQVHVRLLFKPFNIICMWLTLLSKHAVRLLILLAVMATTRCYLVMLVHVRLWWLGWEQDGQTALGFAKAFDSDGELGAVSAYLTEKGAAPGV